MTWERVDLSSPEFERPSEPPVVCGLLYAGMRHAISGPPEAAKTLAALIFGLEWMRAGRGLFALIDFEGGERETRRVLADLGAMRDEIASVYYVAPDEPPSDAEIEALAAAGVTLVGIDSAAGAYAVSGLDDNKRQDAEIFSRVWIVPLWSRGIGTLVLDHVTKNSEARGRYAIGSERKLGTVDVHLGFEPVKALRRGGSGLVRVATHKDRPGHLPRPRAAELELHSAPDSHQVSWAFKPVDAADAEGGDFRPTILMERISVFLEGMDTDGATRTLVEGAVKGKAEWVRHAMDTLLAEGYAAEIPEGRGRRLASVKPFRRESEPVPNPSQPPNAPPSESVPNPSRRDDANPTQHAKNEPVPIRPNSSRDDNANSSPRSPLSRGDGDELTYNQDELDRLERLGDHYGLT